MTSTRDALIDAAAELSAAGGPAAVTLREVGRRAGVSHNAPYKHFADKEELLAAVAARDLARRAVADPAGGPQPHARRGPPGDAPRVRPARCSRPRAVPPHLRHVARGLAGAGGRGHRRPGRVRRRRRRRPGRRLAAARRSRASSPRCCSRWSTAPPTSRLSGHLARARQGPCRSRRPRRRPPRPPRRPLTPSAIRRRDDAGVARIWPRSRGSVGNGQTSAVRRDQRVPASPTSSCAAASTTPRRGRSLLVDHYRLRSRPDVTVLLTNARRRSATSSPPSTPWLARPSAATCWCSPTARTARTSPTPTATSRCTTRRCARTTCKTEPDRRRRAAGPLRRDPDGCADLTVISDSCLSGSVTRGCPSSTPDERRARFVDPERASAGAEIDDVRRQARPRSAETSCRRRR